MIILCLNGLVSVSELVLVKINFQLCTVPISNEKQWYRSTFPNMYHVSKSVSIQTYPCIYSFYKVRQSHYLLPFQT